MGWRKSSGCRDLSLRLAHSKIRLCWKRCADLGTAKPRSMNLLACSPHNGSIITCISVSPLKNSSISTSRLDLRSFNPVFFKSTQYRSSRIARDANRLVTWHRIAKTSERWPKVSQKLGISFRFQQATILSMLLCLPIRGVCTSVKSVRLGLQLLSRCVKI